MYYDGPGFVREVLLPLLFLELPDSILSFLLHPPFRTACRYLPLNQKGTAAADACTKFISSCLTSTNGAVRLSSNLPSQFRPPIRISTMTDLQSPSFLRGVVLPEHSLLLLASRVSPLACITTRGKIPFSSPLLCPNRFVIHDLH